MKKNKPNTQDETSLPVSPSDLDRDITTIKIIKTEVNINRNPFFCLSDKDIPKTLKIERKDTVEIDGKSVSVLWKVSANPEYGYPGPFAKQVHKAFEVLFSQHGFPLVKVFPFSIYQILDIIGVAKKGANYQKVRTAIQQLVSTTIEAKGSFYHKGKQRYIADTYHLFDRVLFKGEVGTDGVTVENNFVFLSDAYLDSINSFYIKDIDWNYYQQLSNVTSGRLYEVLDMLFYPILAKGLPSLKISYKKLCEYMPLKPASYLAKAKQQLDKHHDLLVKTGFLNGYKYDQKPTAKGNDFSIIYFPGVLANKDKSRQQELNWTGSEMEQIVNSDTKSKSSLSKKNQTEPIFQYAEKIRTFGLANVDEILSVTAHSPETIFRLLNDFEQKVKSGYRFKTSPQAWLHWALLSEKYVPPTKMMHQKAKKTSKLEDKQQDLQQMYTKLRDMLNEQEYDQEWINQSEYEKITTLMSSFPFEYQVRYKKQPTENEIRTYEKSVRSQLSQLITDRKQVIELRTKEINQLRQTIQEKMENSYE